MASKRRNMFQKSKTQETTENVRFEMVPFQGPPDDVRDVDEAVLRVDAKTTHPRRPFPPFLRGTRSPRTRDLPRSPPATPTTATTPRNSVEVVPTRTRARFRIRTLYLCIPSYFSPTLKIAKADAPYYYRLVGLPFFDDGLRSDPNTPVLTCTVRVHGLAWSGADYNFKNKNVETSQDVLHLKVPYLESTTRNADYT
ncbi:hypothetical protein AAG570_010876 [Ranatra chinensis]|uniref:Uncharacterized protein n=1 Tax=Ranatra chinensis TaxID=642074 RepID=A0ABD0Z5A1_9HEMI